jgi:predicted ATP-grasp superfamily ATP-dependent carboligase
MTRHGPMKEDRFFQARVDGKSIAGVFVSYRGSDRHIQTLLFGVTEQIVGDKWLGAAAFQYCGSIGPRRIPDAISVQIESVGRCLATEFEIIGMWGVDFIVSENGAMPVDINPRMTASMELFEWSFRQVESGIRSMVDLHVKACRGKLDRPEFEKAKHAIADSDKMVEGKAILFHRGSKPLRISTTTFAALKQIFNSAFYESTEPGFSIADIPQEEQKIKPGHPILTLRIRTQGDQVLSRIHAQAAEIFEALQVATE